MFKVSALYDNYSMWDCTRNRFLILVNHLDSINQY
jgi:hypothetical protein